jgi:hypothetical protein
VGPEEAVDDGFGVGCDVLATETCEATDARDRLVVAVSAPIPMFVLGAWFVFADNGAVGVERVFRSATGVLWLVGETSIPTCRRTWTTTWLAAGGRTAAADRPAVPATSPATAPAAMA